ncbi:hypothetical protein ACFL1B_05440 [Nanoarchaeota archaeon]
MIEIDHIETYNDGTVAIVYIEGYIHWHIPVSRELKLELERQASMLDMTSSELYSYLVQKGLRRILE